MSTKANLSKHDLKGNATKGTVDLKVMETAASTKKEKTKRRSAGKQSTKERSNSDDNDQSPITKRTPAEQDLASKKKTSKSNTANLITSNNNVSKHQPSSAVQTLNFSEIDELDHDKTGAMSTASAVSMAVDTGRM